MDLVLNIQKLQDARISRGLSVTDLAKAAGRNRKTVWKALATGDVGLRSCRLICAALGLAVGDCLVDRRTGRPWAGGQR
jgi:hypothetical protein